MTVDAGGRSRFERFLKPHMPRLYRFALRLTTNRVDADDLFQDVLVRVYPRLDDLAGLRDPAPWLARVMYNYFIDNRRRFARERRYAIDANRLADESIESLANTGRLHDTVWVEKMTTLEQALDMLSEDHRLALLLHDAEGYTLAEIAGITGCAVGTAKSRLHRARRRLREILPDDGTFS